MESYQFIKQMGHGNYGDVWLVKCSKTKKKYVLKRFDLNHATKREQRSAFLEAQLLSTLRHPNIVTYLDSFYNSKGSLFLVMGYCECGDMCSYIRNRNGAYFEEKEVINWFVQICLALKHLHDKNILHRDLKTGNIFLTKTKLIKLGDLGIARVLKAKEDMATTFAGTPYYMSPEMFCGKPYSQKSDIWALGCCMYEIATLKHAFNAQDIHSLMQKVIAGKVASMPKIYTLELFYIITSMLKHDPEKRPSVNELLLNDFVRKYILLFLQESPMKCSSSTSNSNRSTPSTVTNASPTCKQSSFNDLTIIGESLSIRKYMGNADTPKLVKNPDSNGNADGNDNSQQQALNSEAITSPLLPQIDENHETSLCDSLKSYDSEINVSAMVRKSPVIVSHRKSFKENLNPSEESSIMKNSQVTKSAESSAESRSLNAQKIKSEQSFNLLNNLTYSIKNSRFQDLVQFNDGQSRIASRVKYFCGISPPKSAEELYIHSKIVTPDELKRNAKSAKQAMSYERDKCECYLPQIRKHEVGKLIAIRDINKINLPNIQNFENGGLKTIANQLICKDDRFVDKLLLQNIMTCNKEQNGHLNSPARQRRRQKEDVNKISCSAPTSLDILPLETDQKKNVAAN